MKRGKVHDYSQLLLWATILVMTARYVGAFLASDLGHIEGTASEVLSVLIALSGVGMGLLDTLGAAYLIDGWRATMPRQGQKWSFRYKVLTFFLISMLVTGLAILTPFTVSRIAHRDMFTLLAMQGSWIWSLAVNIAPYLLIGGVVTAQRNVVGVASVPTPTTGVNVEPAPVVGVASAPAVPTPAASVNVEPAPNEPSSNRTKRTEVQAYLSANPGASASEIAEATRTTEQYVRKLRREAAHSGHNENSHESLT